jgi:hypothetical protein
MADTPTNEKSNEPPKPEVLKSQSDGEAAEPEETTAAPAKTAPGAPAAPDARQKLRLRRTTYRPSHKATFIGLAVIIGILAINAVIITFVINGQNTSTTAPNLSEVTLSTSSLNKLGVSRNAVGNSAEELVVGPNSRFNGTVTVGSNVSIAGQLTLNSKFSASDASLTNLQAGDTSLSKLNVNGDGTVSNFNLRQNLTVVGTSILQGPVTLSQLLTVNNSVNVVGNVAVGGQLTVRSFQASNLVSDTTLTIGGHIITAGLGPSFARGSALRGVDTVSVGGNDSAGTIQINIGAGSISAGTLIQVAFHAGFSNTPHVVVSPVGGSLGNYYVNRNSSGFSIVATGSVPYGGYAFDYIVVQ